MRSYDSTIVEIHSRAFSNCSKLHTVSLPKCGKIVIESLAFENCINLRNIIIDAQEIEIKDNSFDGCPNVTIISSKADVERYAREHDLDFIKM